MIKKHFHAVSEIPATSITSARLLCPVDQKVPLKWTPYIATQQIHLFLTVCSILCWHHHHHRNSGNVLILYGTAYYLLAVRHSWPHKVTYSYCSSSSSHDPFVSALSSWTSAIPYDCRLFIESFGFLLIWASNQVFMFTLSLSFTAAAFSSPSLCQSEFWLHWIGSSVHYQSIGPRQRLDLRMRMFVWHSDNSRWNGFACLML